MRAGPLLGLTSGGVLIPTTVAYPWVGATVVVVPIILFSSVVLPGVWSRKPERRREARTMVELLLGRTSKQGRR